MGYSHRWYRARELPREAFELFVEDCVQLWHNLPERSTSAGGYYADVPLRIGGWNDGKGEPEFLDHVVAFNGAGTHKPRPRKDWPVNDPLLCHESFVIERVLTPEAWQTPENGKYFEFCKTCRKPYDLLVVACLYAARHRFGDSFIFGSDGKSLEDMQPGYDLWIRVCRPESPAPIDSLAEV